MARLNKKFLEIIFGVAVLVGVGGYIGKTYYEQKIVEEIRSAMASVPAPYYLEADTVAAAVFSRSAVLTGVRAGLKSPAGSMEGTIERIEVTGLNLSALRKGQGSVQVAERVTLHNAVSKSLGITQTMALYELKDVKGDFPLIYEEWAKAYPTYATLSKVVDRNDAVAAQGIAVRGLSAFAGVLEALESAHIGGVSVAGYTVVMPYGGRSLTMRMESAKLTGYSLRRLGPGSLHGLAATLDGEMIFSLKECAVEGIDFPNYPKILKRVKDTADRDLSGILLVDPIAVKKLRLTEMKLLTGSLPLAVAAVSYDMVVGAGGEFLTLAVNVRNVEMAKADLLTLSPALTVVQDALPERLSLGTGLDCAIKKQENGSADVSIKNLELRGENIGHFSMAGNVSDARVGKAANAMVHNATFSLADNGIVDAVLTTQAQEGGADPKILREEMARQVEAQRAWFSDPALQKLSMDIIAFLRQSGGTLMVKLNPRQPISAKFMPSAIIVDPASLGITSSFTVTSQDF